MTIGRTLAILAIAGMPPLLPTLALATPCADEVSTLQRRLDSAGAAEVTGTTPPGGTTSSHSDKALKAPPAGTPSDAAMKPSAAGVAEAKALVAQASAQDKAGDAQACRDTILKAKEKAGALP